MTKELPVHPDAAIFPMMSDEEIAGLAEDIKTNGLIHPLITGDHDGQEVLVDGRNRLAACKQAGVKPTFRKLNGEDQKAFILSVNINRRHMTKGQRAIAVAMIYPDGGGGGGHQKDQARKFESISLSYVKKARVILRSSVHVAQAVLEGSMPFDTAYNEAERRGGELSNQRVRMRKLRADRPDLAEAVENEELKLDEAEKQAKADVDAAKQRRWAATVNIADGLNLLDREPDSAAAILNEFDAQIIEQRGETISPERLRRAASFLSTLADVMENKNASSE